MGSRGVVGDLFRAQLKAERTRRGLSQSQLASAASDRLGFQIHTSTIAKLETGQRDARLDELHVFAELFGVSTDVLLGRQGSSADVLWAASKLTTNAQKIAADLIIMKTRIDGDAQDLFYAAQREHKLPTMDTLIKMAAGTCSIIDAAAEQSRSLSAEFPLPGVRFGG